MPVRFACPHCQAKLKAPDEKSGTKSKCPRCNGAIEVPGQNSLYSFEPDAKEPAKPTPASPAAETPLVRFKCALCGVTLERPEKFAGEQFKCPSCAQLILIPKPKPKVIPPMAPVLGELIDDPEPPTGLFIPEPQHLPAIIKPPQPRCRDPLPDILDVLPVVHYTPGETAPPPQRHPPPPLPSGWVELRVSARIISWPGKCASCLGREETIYRASHTRPDRAGRTKTGWWDVPYCFPCLERVNTRQIGPAVIYDGWNGSVHTLRFWNHDFAREFAERNAGKMLR
jgi:Zn-finger nucleic acid-binding protein